MPTPSSTQEFEQIRASQCRGRYYGGCHLVDAEAGFRVSVASTLCDACLAQGGADSKNDVRSTIVSNAVSAIQKRPDLLTERERKIVSEMHRVELRVSAEPSKRDRWEKVVPTWNQATSFAKSLASKGFTGKRAPDDVIAARHRSCFGDIASGVAPCEALAKSKDEQHHYCNECGCGDRDIAHLDRDKLSYPYLECPRARDGFSNAPLQSNDAGSLGEALASDFVGDFLTELSAQVQPTLARLEGGTARRDRAVSNALSVSGTTPEGDLQELADLVIKSAARTVVEIGTFKGRTTELFLSLGCSVITVDDHSSRWVSTPEAQAKDAVKPESLMKQFEGRTVDFLSGDTVHHADTIRRFIQEKWPSGADLCFIDGGHDAATVTSDLDLCRRVVRRGGMLTGHDADLAGVQEALVSLPGYNHGARMWWVVNPGVPPAPIHKGTVVFDADGGLGDCAAYAWYAEWYKQRGIPCVFVTGDRTKADLFRLLGCTVVKEWPGPKVPIGGKSLGFQLENKVNHGKEGRLTFRGRHLPYRPGFVAPEVILNPLDETEAIKLMGEDKRPVVVVYPRTHFKTRDVPMHTMIDVCWMLEKEGFRTIAVFGTKGEWEPHKDQFPFSLYGYGIGVSASLMKRAACVVGGDTGPIHLAASLGVRTVAVMGPTSNIFKEYGSHVLELSDKEGRLSCTGCWWRQSHGFRAACDAGCASLATFSANRIVQEVKRWSNIELGTTPSMAQ